MKRPFYVLTVLLTALAGSLISVGSAHSQIDVANGGARDVCPLFEDQCNDYLYYYYAELAAAAERGLDDDVPPCFDPETGKYLGDVAGAAAAADVAESSFEPEPTGYDRDYDAHVYGYRDEYGYDYSYDYDYDYEAEHYWSATTPAAASETAATPREAEVRAPAPVVEENYDYAYETYDYEYGYEYGYEDDYAYDYGYEYEYGYADVNHDPVAPAEVTAVAAQPAPAYSAAAEWDCDVAGYEPNFSDLYDFDYGYDHCAAVELGGRRCAAALGPASDEAALVEAADEFDADNALWDETDYEATWTDASDDLRGDAAADEREAAPVTKNDLAPAVNFGASRHGDCWYEDERSTPVSVTQISVSLGREALLGVAASLEALGDALVDLSRELRWAANPGVRVLR